MRINLLCISVLVLLCSCRSYKEVQAVRVDSSQITHNFAADLSLDLEDTILLCLFDTMGIPKPKAKIIRHGKQVVQTCAEDTVQHRSVSRDTKTTQTAPVTSVKSYEYIINWTLFFLFLLFSMMLLRLLKL